MAARRAPSLCLACQARQAVIGRRRPFVVKRRKLETLSTQSGGAGEDGGVILHTTRKKERRDSMIAADSTPSGTSIGEKLQAWDVKQQPETVQEAFQDLESLWKDKDKRVATLRTLSNPWPVARHIRGHNEKRPPAGPKLELPEANAAPIPHAVFRRKLNATTADKQLRQILRAQLLRCQVPVDIFRIVVTALMMNRYTRAGLAALHEPLVRALYRCRDKVDDDEVLRAINGIYGRFQVYNVKFNPQLLVLGLKFAARTRSLRGMKKYLKALRERGRGYVTSNVFRATIAKFSIGHRGLGEIRNGRWKRDELLQVLTGFHDCTHLPPPQQYHLETFLDRSDWQYLHGWIAALARCRQVDLVWREWLSWKETDARRKPKNLRSQDTYVTTKTRGDYWFVEQMVYAGGLELAWRLIEDTGTQVQRLHPRITTKLLEGLEFCTPSVWTAQGEVIRREMVRKYDTELSRIEKALGVAWIPTDVDDEAQGYHVMRQDQEEVLEGLAAEDFKLVEDYGYPYESLVPPKERSLHDAVEVVEEVGA